MNWPHEPFVYEWTPHPEMAGKAPAVSLPAWAPTPPQARVTLFLLTALSIRRLG
jgi:hypothetical protein